MAMKIWLVLLMLALMTATSPARQDEARGIVSGVTDGANFYVDGFGPVRLADVIVPMMGTANGVHSREYALENLLNVQVFLDIDDNLSRSSSGPTPCVVYLYAPGGVSDLDRNFNAMVVRSGYGVANEEAGSEFDTSEWSL
jgi:hypothetical protein